MALSLTLVFGTPCGANQHVSVTGTLSSGQSRTIPITVGDVGVGATAEQLEGFAYVLLKLYRAQMPGATLAQLKTSIEAKTLNLTVS